MSVTSKIEYEFRCFYLDQLKTSRENIFAHSGEIELKKQLLNGLYQLAQDMDEETEHLLLLQSNLLESAYCYLVDVRSQEAADTVSESLASWLTFLKDGEKRKVVTGA